jgi:ABC-2 type transport system permease protein
MLRSVFLKTLYDQRKAVLGWSLGLGALGLFAVLFYPSVKEAGAYYDQMLQLMPQEYMAFLGNITSFTQVDGYMTASLMVYLPLVLAIYAIGLGVGLVTGEVESGTMDLLLAHPLPRWRVVLEKYAAMATALFAICLIFGLTLLAGGLMIRSQTPDVPPIRWLLAGLNVFPLTLFFGSVAFALACAVRGRAAAVATATTIAVGSFMLNGLVPISERLQPLEKWTIYYWYTASKPFTDGIILGHVLILLGLCLLCLGAGIVGFGRRDVIP